MKESVSLEQEFVFLLPKVKGSKRKETTKAPRETHSPRAALGPPVFVRNIH